LQKKFINVIGFGIKYLLVEVIETILKYFEGHKPHWGKTGRLPLKCFFGQVIVTVFNYRVIFYKCDA